MRREQDVASSPLPEFGTPPHSSSRRRWWLRAVWLLGFLSPILWLLWRLYGPPERIVVSYETTRITSPLKADGRSVDYGAALRKQFQSSKAVSLAETPVGKLLRHRAKVRPSSSDAVPTFYDPDLFLSQEHIVSQQDRHRFRDRIHGQLPIVADSDPELADIIESNIPWYNAVMQQPAVETTLSLDALDLEDEANSNPLLTDPLYCRDATMVHEIKWDAPDIYEIRRLDDRFWSWPQLN